MFDAPEVMRMAQDMARHAAQRQAITARNTANADTPGYRAQDLTDFATTLRQGEQSIALRRTRSEHQAGAALRPTARVLDAGGTPSPNGNTVSLEQELVRSGRAKSQHDTALTIYKASLDLMRSALGRGR